MVRKYKDRIFAFSVMMAASALTIACSAERERASEPNTAAAVESNAPETAIAEQDSKKSLSSVVAVKKPKTPYKADFIYIAGKGDEEIPGTIWYQDGWERRDMGTSDDPGRKSMTMIVFPNEPAGLLISPGDGFALKIPIEPADRDWSYAMLSGDGTTVQGHENINDERVTVYRVDNEKFGGYVSVTEDGIIMRFKGVTMLNGKWLNLTLYVENIERGAIDPSIFEPPAGMQVMDADALARAARN